VTAAVAEDVGARRYETVIGIETHCELGTATKMFCACPTVFGADPNTQVCPVCLGEPGSLPVVNARAVEYAARIGLALHCRIAERSQFHRKNYFYPDMPKNYQISQYDEPLCVGGWLDVDVEGEVRRIGITRVHMEEDTGKSLHVGATGRIHGADYSLVDYNRAGIPLVEIVSEPDLRSAEEARAYAEELRALLLSLGVSDAKLEEGSMRFDVNVSIRPVGHADFGTKVELKNLNSLRSLYRAVGYEAERQRRVLAGGGQLAQETRHWDEGAGRTEPMRSKEFATDYRYFPEPDLVPIEATAGWVDGLRAELPELPAERRARLAEATGLPAKEVGWLVRDPEVLDYFQAVTGGPQDAGRAGGPGGSRPAPRSVPGRDPKVVAGWVMGELQRNLREHGRTMASNPVGPERLGELLDLVAAGTVSATAAKDVLAEMFSSEASPTTIVKRKGLAQISDTGELEAVVERVVAANPDLAEKFRGGKRGVLGALIGQVMRETRGRANPKLVSDLLERAIGG
jgi:aspartyl-tRNA(Asn)/glutamyl-tRNA(Gln) amidotransferase subunit B